jgi:hypothetical protein
VEEDVDNEPVGFRSDGAAQDDLHQSVHLHYVFVLDGLVNKGFLVVVFYHHHFDNYYMILHL